VVIYEVYKQLARQRGKPLADRFLAQALQCRVVPLDEMIALAAANFSTDHRLNMADAIIYATARSCQAQLVTANTRFRGLPGVIIP
jgi:predicted nucleic acid-binding protein